MALTCYSFCGKGFSEMNAVSAVPPTMKAMNKISTPLAGVFILEPRVFGAERGFFLESYNEWVFAELGITEGFVQGNYSSYRCKALRGLHYQIKHAQGKLVRAAAGDLPDVA